MAEIVEMSSSPSGKANDCKPFSEGSIPSEDSVRDRMLSILALKIETLNKLILTRNLSSERQNAFYKLRKRAQNLYNWLDGGGSPTPSEIRRWLR